MRIAAYASPLAFKQAVEARLRATAVREGVPLARLRQLLVFDRFLARIGVAFGDRAVVKGGVVVELRVKRARTTKDIDLRLPGDPARALEEFQAAGRMEMGDFLLFEVQRNPRRGLVRTPGMRYPIRRYSVRALLAAKVYGSPFGLDVAFAEPFSGEVESIQGPPFLKFAGVSPARIRIYPLEAHIAEKLHAYTMPRSRPNSRVKDLPDIALLASVRVLDANSLLAAIRRTFRARATHPVPVDLPPPPDSWGAVYEAMARSDGLVWRDINAVFGRAAAFLDPVLAGIPGRWNPESWAWRTIS